MADHPLTAGARLGPYEIVGRLGAGGMGEVYRARDTRLDRDVAIKILPAEFTNDPDRRARFEREARAVAAVNHPHIVTLYEVGTSEAGPYLVLEKIEGRSLGELIRTGPVSIRRLVSLAAQIADGLAKAHGAGIVHRDLKPNNIMVTDDGVAKILDFGLAKMAWPELDAWRTDADTTLARDTESGLILGTLGYLSPEQAAGRPADFRADQFALGALLYELATGTRPFRRATMAESLTATIREEPASLRSKRADLPAPFCWIVERCLAKDPDERYASTRDLARDLADVRDRLSDIGSGAAHVEAPAGAAGPRARLAWMLAALGGLALLGASYWVGRRTAPSAPELTFTPLTFQRGIITGARFGPDGKTVYYSAAFGAEPSRVYVTRLDGTESELLKLPPAMLLSVSSKGELAILQTMDSDILGGRNVANGVGTLARVPAFGGTPRPLIERANDADWAPDGERLAIARSDYSIEFPVDHRIAPEGQMPRISPTGDHVAWIGNPGVEVADLTGKVSVTSGQLWGFGLAWAPGGREVWFTASTAPGDLERQLYGLSLDGTVRSIAHVPGGLTLFDVAPSGHAALVSTGGAWWSLVATRRGQSQERPLDLYGRSTIQGLSADGKWILAQERRGVARGAYLRSTDGTETVRLGRIRAVGLSPDGKWVLAAATEDDSTRLELLPVGPGSARTVPVPAGMELPPYTGLAQWSADGRRVFVPFKVRGRNDGGARVYMRDGDAAWRAVTPARGGRFAVSPDGKTVAGRSDGVVTLFPVDGGTPTVLDGERGLPVSWSADGAWLVLARSENLKIILYRRELKTGKVEPWRTVGPLDLSGVTQTDPSVFLSADGGLCVYSYTRTSNTLYLIDGLR
jgi:eukaryotic-like serine/threonine-protein kinase